MLKLPRLKANLAIVNPKGNPLDYFLRFWNIEVAPAIERQEAAQDVIIQQLIEQDQQLIEQNEIIQAQQEQLAYQLELVQTALELAGLALGFSGSSREPDISFVVGGPWVSGPEVDLTGVPAGTLTFPGTGLENDDNTEFEGSAPFSATGEIRVVEVVSGIDEVIATYSWSANKPTISAPLVITNSSAISSASFARTSTGDITYRLDARQISGDTLNNAGVFLFVRRSA